AGHDTEQFVDVVQRFGVLIEDATEHDECRHQQRVARSDPERRGFVHLRQDVRVLAGDKLQREIAEEVLLRGLFLRAEHLEFMLERRLSCGHTITSMGQPKYDGSIRRRWTADEDQGSKSSRASGGLFILSARPLPNTALMKTPGAGFDRTASVCPFCGS